tara:strand:- start:100 stop:1002 length:903 start_codon:yes stop_codon:yes gene_type:complete
MIVPFDFLNGDLDDVERGLAKVYHTGQNKIWNGREVLDKLFKKYSDTKIKESHREPLQNILSIILWGEYVAWTVSSEMSANFKEFGAKIAAVSQAHDEARHFYVMRDYLQRRLNYKPSPIFGSALFVLKEVSTTNDLARKLLGMQLMIEPVAITIFRFIRKSNVDPILNELLEYYEADEARHIAIGMKYLPKLIKKMSAWEKILFILWQIKMIDGEIRGLKSIEEDLIKIGLNPLDVFEFAEMKQVSCLKLLSKDMGIGEGMWKPVLKLIRFRKKIAFYPDKRHGTIQKIINSFFEAIKK